METLTHLGVLATAVSLVCGLFSVVNASRRFDARHRTRPAAVPRHPSLGETFTDTQA